MADQAEHAPHLETPDHLAAALANRVGKDDCPPRKPTVLIVDDSSEDLELLEEALSPAFKVLLASSGPQALERAAGTLPDLVLLDVRMPGMDGYEVCRRFKAERRLARVPVIFLTGMDQEDSEAAGLVLGAVDFISKAAPRGLLHLRIRNHLNQKLLMDRQTALTEQLRAALEGRKQEEERRAELEARLQQGRPDRPGEALSVLPGGLTPELDHLLAAILEQAAAASLASTPGGEAAKYLQGIEQAALRAKALVHEAPTRPGA